MKKIPNNLSIDITEILKVNEHYYEAKTKHFFNEVGYYYLIYIKDGSINLEIDENIFILNTNQLIITKIKKTSYFFTSKQSAKVISLIFRERYENINEIIHHRFTIKNRCKALINSLCMETEEITFLKKRKPSITYDKEIGEFFNISCTLLYSLLTQLLLVLIKEVAYENLPENIIENIVEFRSKNQSFNTLSSSNTVNSEAYNSQLVNEIISFMKNNLNKNYSLDDLAQEFFVGSSNLKKIFKKETGFSIMNYFKSLKMQTAKKWVRENELSYTEISDRLGFSSIHHFSATFKKSTGYSPSRYYDSLQSGSTLEISNVDLILTENRLGGGD